MRNRLAPLILILALAFVVVGTTYLYANGQPDVYTSKAVLTMSPRNPLTVGGDNLTLAAARYAASLGSEQTLGRVAADLGEPMEQVIANTTVVVQPATINIEIAVTLRDRDRAASIVNAVASAGVASSRIDPLVSLDLIVPAVTVEAPGGPNRRLMLIGGSGFALLLALLGIAALGYFQNSPGLAAAGAPIRIPRRQLA
jgi:capsular polysaccharide biosynthesis protein